MLARSPDEPLDPQWLLSASEYNQLQGLPRSKNRRLWRRWHSRRNQHRNRPIRNPLLVICFSVNNPSRNSWIRRCTQIQNMGSALSTTLAWLYAANNNGASSVPDSEPLCQRGVGVPLPQQASKEPEDLDDWYDNFFEKAFCIPRKDGNNMIIMSLKERDLISRSRAGWPVKHLRKAYELMNGNHPRVVRYVF
jgi:hypothetical protein